MPLIIQGEGNVEVRSKHSCRVEFQVLDTATGKVKRMRSSAMHIDNNTKKERERCRREYRKELESGQRQDTKNMTVRAFSEQWLERRKQSSEVKESTIRKDEGRLKVINMHLGDAKLVNLDVQTIEGFYAHASNGESPSGKRLSGTYVNGVGATLRQILQEAVRYDIITKNPAEHAKRPKKDTEEVIPLATPEITRMQLLLDGSKPRPSLAGFYLALFAGLRRGEICGLRWCDVDLEGDTPELTVRHSLDSKTCELSEPKTPASKRTISLFRGLADYLQAWKSHQACKLHKYGIPQDDYYVVCTPGAQYMHPENLARSWNRFSKEFGFNVTLHGLRHSFCTYLCVTGVELQYAQYLMGHADIQTTANIYTHCTFDMKREAGRALTEATDKLPAIAPLEMRVSQNRWGVVIATPENEFPQISPKTMV